MQQRVKIEQTLPSIWKAMYALSGSVTGNGLSPIQRHLITMRASQINNCAFCLSIHTKESLHAGETQQRIFLLSAWRETTLFIPEERAILALTEEVCTQSTETCIAERAGILR